MDKEFVTPQSLMDDAGIHFTNLVSSGSWKLESSKHAQINALTTQLSELKTEMQSLSKNSSEKSKGSTSDKPSFSAKNYRNFEAWRLTKVNNSAEFSMVEKDSKNFFGVTSISIQDATPKGCMYFTSLLSMMHGKHIKMSRTKSAAKRLTEPSLQLQLPLQLFFPMLLLPHRLTRQNCLLQSLFRKF